MVSRIARTTFVSAAVAVLFWLAAVPSPLEAITVRGVFPYGPTLPDAPPAVLPIVDEELPLVTPDLDLTCKPAGPIQIQLRAGSGPGGIEWLVRPHVDLSDLSVRIVGPDGTTSVELDPRLLLTSRGRVSFAGPAELLVTGTFAGSEGPETVTVRRRIGHLPGPVGPERSVGQGRRGRRIELPVSYEPAG